MESLLLQASVLFRQHTPHERPSAQRRRTRVRGAREAEANCEESQHIGKGNDADSEANQVVSGRGVNVDVGWLLVNGKKV